MMGRRNEIREERGGGRERRIGHLPCANEGSVQDERCSEKALRRLSRSIEEVRLHSRHGQICACVYVLLIRSHSFFFLSLSFYVSLRLFTHTNEDKRDPLVYVLRIIISSRSLSLVSSPARKFFVL